MYLRSDPHVPSLGPPCTFARTPMYLRSDLHVPSRGPPCTFARTSMYLRADPRVTSPGPPCNLARTPHVPPTGPPQPCGAVGPRLSRGAATECLRGPSPLPLVPRSRRAGASTPVWPRDAPGDVCLIAPLLLVTQQDLGPQGACPLGCGRVLGAPAWACARTFRAPCPPPPSRVTAVAS
jgi:hypothetical protein